MNTLTKSNISYSYSAGLPEEFYAMKNALAYAEGNMSQSEYAEIYDLSSDAYKAVADKIVADIFAATIGRN